MLQLFIYWLSAFVQIIWNFAEYYLHQIVDVLDYYAPSWRIYILSPFVIVFLILPLLLIVYLYLSALLLFTYRQRKPILDAFHRRDLWEGCRRTMAVLWSGHGWIWHGYEVVGFENIPDTGPALIIYYHGAFPIDFYYLLARVYLEKGRVIRNVVDNFVFKIPGLAKLFRFWESFPGPRSRVIEVLRSGEIVSIAPGGLREALFSENYSLLWKNRVGFAKAALEAEVTILPMFTENCRQAFDYVGFGKKVFRPLYERIRWPIMPMYGGFPVKMRTHIGKPIKHDPSLTPEALSNKVQDAIRALVDENQHASGSVLKAIFERFRPRKRAGKPIEILTKHDEKDNKRLPENSKSHLEGFELAVKQRRLRSRKNHAQNSMEDDALTHYIERI